MAADTIRNYLETGTIVNSVNLPNTRLPDRDDNSVRFTVVNKNVPGAHSFFLSFHYLGLSAFLISVKT